MPDATLDALLNSWDRNNTILVNLLGALPDGAMDARPMNGSPTVGAMFAHIHYVRLVFIAEDAPECAVELPADEWRAEPDRERLSQMLRVSAAAVRDAVKRRIETGREMDVHYDHPILFLQHMIWHEGYHHGQIKLALKAAGVPLDNKTIGPLTWRVWMNKTTPPGAR
jgi:uncharacterized damage-inducible protein DinB